jgi:TolA-binding protein
VLHRCKEAGLVSEADEAEGDFRARVSHRLRELRDLELEKVRNGYGPRLQRVEDRIRKAEDRVARERSQHQEQKVQTAISFGTTVLSAVLGRRRVSATSLNRAGAAMRGVGRVGREREDIARAEEGADAAREELARLEAELAAETERLQAMGDPAHVSIEELRLAPRKSDIDAAEPVLVWVPWVAVPGEAGSRAGLRANG